jgi:uncharacterized membrane protein
VTVTDSPSPSEHLQHIAHRLSGAVYGTILATTVVVSFQGHGTSMGTAVVIVVVTSLVFWVAHVYSRAIAQRLVVRRRLTGRDVGRIARDEWPMLQSSVPVLVPLLLGWVGLLDGKTAAWLAVLVGVGALFAYGLVIGIREEAGWRHTALSSVATGSFGLVILALKVVVH